MILFSGHFVDFRTLEKIVVHIRYRYVKGYTGFLLSFMKRSTHLIKDEQGLLYNILEFTFIISIINNYY